MIKYLLLILSYWTLVSSQGTSEVFTYYNPNSFSMDYVFQTNNCCWNQYTCFSEMYAGPFNGDVYLTRNWTLLPHWKVYVYFKLVLFDTSSYGMVNFEADGRQYMNLPFYYAESYGVNNCRAAGKDYATTYAFDLYHTSTTLNLTWYSLGSAYYDQGWGLNYVQLTMYYCLTNCDYCVENTKCLTCKAGYYLWKENPALDVCLPCPSGATACDLDQATGILSFQTEFNSTIGGTTGWTSMPGSSSSVWGETCDGELTSLFYDSTKYLTKTWPTLPTHSSVQFKMNVYSIDTWSNKKFYVSIPSLGEQVDKSFRMIDSSRFQNLCGDEDINDDVYAYTANFSHTTTSLTARLNTNVASPNAFAVNNVQVNVSLCYDSNCLLCDTPYICNTCIDYYYPHPYSDHYHKCLQCPGGSKKCEIVETETNRNFILKEFDSTGFDEAATGWTISTSVPSVTSDAWECDDKQYLGRFGNGDYISKTYGPALPPHHRFQVQATVFRFDGWDGNSFYIRNGNSPSSTIFFSQKFNGTTDPNISTLCPDEYIYEDEEGEELPEYNYDGYYNYTTDWVADKNANIYITLNSNLPGSVDYELASWGVADLEVIINLCLDADCLDCDSNDNCNQCATGTYKLGPYCNLECFDGYWENPATMLCDNCMDNCEKCSNVTVCELCNSTYFWDGTACIQDCPYGRWGYNYTRTCQPCPPKCLDCYSPDNCTECIDEAFLLEGQCGSFCPEGFLKNDPENKCDECMEPCYGCNTLDANDCTSCYAGTFFHENTCIGDCTPHGLWNDIFRNECGACHSSCNQCSGDKANQCLKCNEDRWLESSWCNTTCSSGKFQDNSTWTCKNCHNQCKECSGTGSDDCIACNNGKYLNEGSCSPNCPTGKFKNSTANTCDLCPTECSSCDSLDVCNTCNEGWYLQDKKCNTTCKGAFFPNDENNKCEACHKSCKQCTDKSADDCTKCYAGTSLYDGRCLNKCPDGWYSEENVCYQCLVGCKTCDSLTECTSCDNGYILDFGKCLVDNCTAPCRTCNGDGADNCLSCYTDRLLQETSCELVCKKGYFQQNPSVNKCQKCTEGCKECADGDFMLGDKCVTECPEGYEPALLDTAQMCITTSRAPSIVLSVIPSEEEEIHLDTDVVIQTEISSFGSDVPIIWWDMVNVTKEIKDIFFTGLNLNNSNLVVPKKNLLPNTVYNLIISAAIEEDVNTQQFTFKTVKNIEQGTFYVSPTEGFFYQTTFTITLKDWVQDGFDVFYDLYTYYQEFDTSKNEFVNRERIAIKTSIANSEGAITVTFKVPPAKAARTQMVELVAFSSSDTVIKTIPVKLSAISEDDLKALLKNTDANSLNDPIDIVNYGKATLQIYDLDADEKAAISAALKVVENYATLTNTTDFCPNDLFCEGQGTCSFQEGIRVCTCDSKFAGRNCEFNKTDFDEAQKRMNTLVTKILGLTLNNETVGHIVGTLQILTTQPAFITEDSLGLIVKLVRTVSESAFVDANTASSMLEGVSNLLKALSASPLLKKSGAMIDLYRIIQKASNALLDDMGTGDAVRIVSDEFETQMVNPVDSLEDACGAETDEDEEDDEEGRLLGLKRVSPRRIPVRRTCLQKLKKPLGLSTAAGSAFELPTLTFQAKSKITFALQEFKSNQRNAENAGRLVSSTTSLEIKDGNSVIPIQDLKKPITITIPKVSPTDPTKITLKYKCTYYDANTNQFRSDGCELIGETMTAIICACVHLTEFAITLDDDIPEGEVYVKPQISLNGLMESQATQLKTSTIKSTYTFKRFTEKYQKYVEVPGEVEPFKLYGAFIVAPTICVITFLFCQAYSRPYLDDDIASSAKASTSISKMLNAKKKKNKMGSKSKNSNGITAAALFSAFTTSVENVKLPRHIRLLYFFALLSIMCGVASLLSYLFAGMASLQSIVTMITDKFVVMIGALITIILGNLLYDIFIGIFNYKVVHKAPTPTTNKQATRMRIKQTLWALFIAIGFISLPIVMLMMAPTGIRFFPWMVILAVIIDFFVIDIAIWVYAPVSKRRILRMLLQMRGFFIEEFVDIENQYKPAVKFDPEADAENEDEEAPTQTDLEAKGKKGKKIKEKKPKKEDKKKKNKKEMSLLQQALSKEVEPLKSDRDPLRIDLSSSSN